MLIFVGSSLVTLVILILVISDVKDTFNKICAVILMIAIFVVIMGLPKLGSPIIVIKPGTYKVAFVYQAGENVSLGIEKPKGNKVVETEELYLYQFPKKDFEGEIKTGAKKLVATKLITGEGTFNRYKLE